ncbi:universal stress protein [Enterococcus saigonensis]|uniref:Universal stress protein n=1 Tax=Enterococcus saigonensis TaxID=1805431 RepID=A0A679ILE3_9ENTE|nr:universal stress protein [Enterococcus saigonensis]BCA86086.1 universal stress protein [Enterococcus saigonensis]
MKKSFTHILVAVDDSDDSKKAFEYALTYAIEQQAELTITTIFEINRLNVYEYLTPETLALHKQKTIAIAENYRKRALSQGVKKVAIVVDEGTPATVILEKVLPAVKPDLLICGSKSKPNQAPFVLGSQAALLAKGASCSVLIIR